MTPEEVSKAWRDWFESVRPKDGSDWCDACREWHQPEEHIDPQAALQALRAVQGRG